MSAVLDPSTIPQAAALELAPPRDTAVMPGFNSNSSWELAQRIGKAFASSTLVPEAYRGNLANCIVALEMANRMGASPLLVMQNLYIVHGNPGWSSKFLIACFNQSGRYSSMRYEWNQARSECRAWAIEKSTGERLLGPLVTMTMAKDEGWSTKAGSKWKTMPELMLMYRSAAFFVRTYAPEISMGLRTDDELVDTVDDARPAAGLSAVRAALGHVDQVTGEVPPPSAAPSAAVAKPSNKTYAQLADELQKAGDPESAALALDQGRELPNDQYDELVSLYTKRWGGTAD